MYSEEKTFQWKPVLWSAILIFILSMLLVNLAPTLYATYTGFQTRGDSELIDAAVQQVIKAPWFIAYAYLATALVAFWRGWVLGKKIADRPAMHVGAMALLAFAIPLTLDAAGGAPSLQHALFNALAIFGGAYLGAFLTHRREVAATA